MFIWRNDLSDQFKDYWMTRLTFGVSTLPFTANMAVKHNAINMMNKHLQVAKVVFKSFYVDDGLVGAETMGEGKKLHGQLQELFPAK